jgi:hypothetical protein
MRARGEEEKVTAFSCGEYTERKCRNTILKEEGVVDRVSDWPQGAGLRELKAEYSPPLIPATFSSCFFLSRNLRYSSEAGGKAFRRARLMPVICGHYTRGMGLCRL